MTDELQLPEWLSEVSRALPRSKSATRAGPHSDRLRISGHHYDPATAIDDVVTLLDLGDPMGWRLIDARLRGSPSRGRRMTWLVDYIPEARANRAKEDRDRGRG